MMIIVAIVVKAIVIVKIGDPKNTVRGYCLDIPRFEESLND